jgi:hypothetical protein
MVLPPRIGSHARHLNHIKIGRGQYDQWHLSQWMRVAGLGLMQAAEIVLKLESPRLDEWEHVSQRPQMKRLKLYGELIVRWKDRLWNEIRLRVILDDVLKASAGGRMCST